MTSTTSFKKGFAVFRWSLRSNRSIMIVYAAVLGFFALINTMFGVGINGLETLRDSGGMVLNSLPIAQMASEATVIAAIFALVIHFKEFKFMHNKRETDMFGSMPVSRRALFFSKLCANFVLAAVPFAVVMTILGILSNIGNFADIDSYDLTQGLSTGIWSMFLDVVVAIAANLMFLAFLSVCCGRVGDKVVSYIVICGAYPIAMVLLQVLPYCFLYGYAPEFNKLLTVALSPICASFSNLWWYWLIYTAVLGAASFFMLRRRRSESAQSHFAYKLPFYVIKLFVSFAAGLLTAFIVTLINYDLDERLAFWIGMVLGSFIAMLVIHVIFMRGFKGFAKGLISYGAMLACFAVVFVMLATGWFGYNSAVPKAEDIRSVTLKIGTIEENGKNILEYEVTDKQFIAETLQMQKNMVEQIDKNNYPIRNLASSGIRRLLGDVLTSGDGARVTYNLKNGTSLTRDYSVYDGESQDFLKSEEFVRCASPVFNLDDKYLIEMVSELNYSIISDDDIETEEDERGIYYDRYDGNRSTALKVLDAFRKDFDEHGYTEKGNMLSGYELDLTYGIPDFYQAEKYTVLQIPKTYTRTLTAIYGDTLPDGSKVGE